VTLYDRAALVREEKDVVRLAEGEGLFAHAEAVRARLARRQPSPPKGRR
jgi:histidinol dehydrogenase